MRLTGNLHLLKYGYIILFYHQIKLCNLRCRLIHNNHHMKHLLLATIVSVLLVGCGESQQSASTPEAKPESETAKAPDIDIPSAATEGNF